MKNIIFTALIAVASIGSASADYDSNIDSYLAYGNDSIDINSLPATAAGPSVEQRSVTLPTGWDNETNQ